MKKPRFIFTKLILSMTAILLAPVSSQAQAQDSTDLKRRKTKQSIVNTNEPTQYENQDLTHLNEYEVMDILKKKVSLKGSLLKTNVLSKMRLGRADISGLDATNQDFSGTQFDHTIMHSIILKRNQLAGNIFNNCDFSNSNLRKQDLGQMTFYSKCNLSGVKVKRNQFSGINLSNTIQAGNDLTRHDLTHTILKNVDFRNAKIGYHQLRGKDLTGADLSGFDLRPYDLNGTILTYTKLNNVILNPGQLSGKQIYFSELLGTEIGGQDILQLKHLSDNMRSSYNVLIDGRIYDGNEIINSKERFEREFYSRYKIVSTTPNEQALGPLQKFPYNHLQAQLPEDICKVVAQFSTNFENTDNNVADVITNLLKTKLVSKSFQQTYENDLLWLPLLQKLIPGVQEEDIKRGKLAMKNLFEAHPYIQRYMDAFYK